MLCPLLIAGPAAATPNMIRLGYPQCQSCHLTPQGGGLLTSYGEGIDLAQTLRPREPDIPEFGEDELGSRLNYDARLSLGIDREPPSSATYGFNTSLRAAAGFMNHRIVYSAGIASPTLARSRTSGAVTSACRGSTGCTSRRRDSRSSLAATILRPPGLTGLQSFSRRVNNPSVSQRRRRPRCSGGTIAGR